MGEREIGGWNVNSDCGAPDTDVSRGGGGGGGCLVALRERGGGRTRRRSTPLLLRTPHLRLQHRACAQRGGEGVCGHAPRVPPVVPDVHRHVAEPGRERERDLPDTLDARPRHSHLLDKHQLDEARAVHVVRAGEVPCDTDRRRVCCAVL